jgi:glycerol-3-phosphate dehydrogenase (NAD(P)+)
LARSNKAPLAVLGAGSWGTALAVLVARNGAPVRLWGHEPDHMERLALDRENRQFLPGIAFPAQLVALADLQRTVSDAGEILLVVPSHAFAAVSAALHPLLPGGVGICWATKGFDPTSGRLLHQVAADIFGAEQKLAVASGPTFAREVAQGLPTAITVASPDRDHARRVAGYLHSERFRAYTSDDIVGVQVGGAAKNVLAIAAGIADGLGFGANTRAALITRGLRELTRLGLALGGRADTFMGLAGLGDLALTCTDDQSRNRRMGMYLARGLDVAEARAEIGQEVEGVGATKVVFRTAHKLGVEMPICEQVYRVIYEGISPLQATQALLERASRAESE